jgi:hypothetical protein
VNDLHKYHFEVAQCLWYSAAQVAEGEASVDSDGYSTSLSAVAASFISHAAYVVVCRRVFHLLPRFLQEDDVGLVLPYKFKCSPFQREDIPGHKPESHLLCVVCHNGVQW